MGNGPGGRWATLEHGHVGGRGLQSSSAPGALGLVLRHQLHSQCRQGSGLEQTLPRQRCWWLDTLVPGGGQGSCRTAPLPGPLWLPPPGCFGVSSSPGPCPLPWVVPHARPPRAGPPDRSEREGAEAGRRLDGSALGIQAPRSHHPSWLLFPFAPPQRPCPPGLASLGGWVGLPGPTLQRLPPRPLSPLSPTALHTCQGASEGQARGRQCLGTGPGILPAAQAALLLPSAWPSMYLLFLRPGGLRDQVGGPVAGAPRVRLGPLGPTPCVQAPTPSLSSAWVCLATSA